MECGDPVLREGMTIVIERPCRPAAPATLLAVLSSLGALDETWPAIEDSLPEPYVWQQPDRARP